MPGGFFNLNTNQSPNAIQKKNRIAERADCKSCKLNKSCITPNFPIYGNGEKKILIVSENPTAIEDEQKKGGSGRLTDILKRTLADYDIQYEKDCWETKAILCRFKGELKDPWIEYCRYNLTQTIKNLSPEKIIVLGGTALKSI